MDLNQGLIERCKRAQMFFDPAYERYSPSSKAAQ